jgi:hypothetical protein
MGQSTTVIPTGGGGASVQDTEPTNPSIGDLWVDTSTTPEVTRWYSGTEFIRVVPNVTVGGVSNINIPQEKNSISIEQKGNPRTYRVDMTNNTLFGSVVEHIDITTTIFNEYSGGGFEYVEVNNGPILHFTDGTTIQENLDGNTLYGPNSVTTSNINKVLDYVEITVESNNDFGLPHTSTLDITGTANIESNHTHEIP